MGLTVVRMGVADVELSGTPSEIRAHMDALPGHVTISGLAERSVEADRAVVQLSVVTSDRKLQPAMAENTAARSEIIGILAEGGITEARIHTSRFASTPVQSSWTGKIKEYRIKSTIRIYAEAEKDIHLIAGLVDTMEAVSLTSLTFEMTKKEEIAIELMKEAFDRIQIRRDLYESSLGVLLRPRNVGLPVPKRPDRREYWAIADDADYGSAYLSRSGILSNPECSVVLHALEQRAPEVSQFEEVLFKVRIVVTFDVLPQPKTARAGGRTK